MYTYMMRWLICQKFWWPWEAEAVHGWGDACERVGVDKEGDHQILCMYENYVADMNGKGK